MISFFSVIGSLKSLVFGISTERERLKSALESELQVPSTVSNQNIVTLKNSLNQVLQQNMDLKTRLVKIHEASDLADLSCVENLTENVSLTILDSLLIWVFYF